jgi:hypothetical protein
MLFLPATANPHHASSETHNQVKVEHVPLALGVHLADRHAFEAELVPKLPGLLHAHVGVRCPMEYERGRVRRGPIQQVVRRESRHVPPVLAPARKALAPEHGGHEQPVLRDVAPQVIARKVLPLRLKVRHAERRAALGQPDGRRDLVRPRALGDRVGGVTVRQRIRELGLVRDVVVLNRDLAVRVVVVVVGGVGSPVHVDEDARGREGRVGEAGGAGVEGVRDGGIQRGVGDQTGETRAPARPPDDPRVRVSTHKLGEVGAAPRRGVEAVTEHVRHARLRLLPVPDRGDGVPVLPERAGHPRGGGGPLAGGVAAWCEPRAQRVSEGVRVRELAHLHGSTGATAYSRARAA